MLLGPDADFIGSTMCLVVIIRVKYKHNSKNGHAVGPREWIRHRLSSWSRESCIPTGPPLEGIPVPYAAEGLPPYEDRLWEQEGYYPTQQQSTDIQEVA